MSKTVYLNTPLSADDVNALELDDVVFLSGTAFTMMYPSHFTQVMDLLDRGSEPPFPLRNNAIYHTGTIFCRKDDGTYDFRAIGTTTSSKFNAFMPEFIRKTGIRAVIGKGGLDEHTLAAMKECGCVYLSAVCGCTSIYTPGVEALEREFWPQPSWADNLLQLKLNQLGPLFVTMDCKGGSIFSQITDQAQKNLPEVYNCLRLLSPQI